MSLGWGEATMSRGHPHGAPGDGDGVISAVLGTCVMCTVYCAARTPGVSLSETVAVTTCEHWHNFLAKPK